MSYLVPQILICTVTMSLLTLAFFGIRKLLEQKQSARWRYAVWWILGIGFLIPLKPRIGRGIFRIPVYHDMYGVAVSPNNGAGSVYIDRRLIKVMLVIWLIGAVIAAARMISRQYHFARSVRRLGKPAGEVAQTVYQLVCMDMEIPAYAEVYVLPMIQTPMMTGLFQPCILLPNEEYSSEELRMIFKHELTHYLRSDLWCKLLWMVCSVLHWFNPLMPKFIRQMEQDCEMACDETVLRGESEETAAAYCNTILDTAMRRCRARAQNTILATNFSSSKENLRSRIHSILFRGRKRRFMGVALALGFFTLLTGSLVSFASRYHSEFVPAMAGEMAEVYEVTDIMEAFATTCPVPVESSISYEADTTFTELIPEAVIDESDTIYFYEDGHAVTELPPEVIEEGIPADVIYGTIPNAVEEAWITSYEEDLARMQEEHEAYLQQMMNEQETYFANVHRPEVWAETSLP